MTAELRDVTVYSTVNRESMKDFDQGRCMKTFMYDNSSAGWRRNQRRATGGEERELKKSRGSHVGTGRGHQGPLPCSMTGNKWEPESLSQCVYIDVTSSTSWQFCFHFTDGRTEAPGEEMAYPRDSWHTIPICVLTQSLQMSQALITEIIRLSPEFLPGLWISWALFKRDLLHTWRGSAGILLRPCI